jgi:hypothetical protein
MFFPMVWAFSEVVDELKYAKVERSSQAVAKTDGDVRLRIIADRGLYLLIQFPYMWFDSSTRHFKGRRAAKRK